MHATTAIRYITTEGPRQGEKQDFSDFAFLGIVSYRVYICHYKNGLQIKYWQKHKLAACTCKKWQALENWTERCGLTQPETISLEMDYPSMT